MTLSSINNGLKYIVRSGYNLISRTVSPTSQPVNQNDAPTHFPQKYSRQIADSDQATVRAQGSYIDFPFDVLQRIILNLDLISLSQFSKTCKRCYFACASISDKEQYWQSLFNQRLSQISPSIRSPLTIEYQFKSVYTEFAEKRKAINCKITILWQEIHQLRGDSGFNGIIDKKWRNLQEFQEHYSQFSADLQDDLGPTYLNYFNLYFRFHNQLLQRTGDSFQGTAETVDPHSQLGKLQTKLQENENMFTEQEKFETFLENYEANKNIERIEVVIDK